jgi:SHS2 domain-containing protein
MAESDTGHWEHFEHQADIGVRGVGNSMGEAFAQAATAMTAIICDPQGVRSQQKIEIHLDEPDPELLLADWLNAIIYQMAVKNMLFGRFVIRIEDGSLDADIYGEKVDRVRHQPVVEVKGATYTELCVCPDNGHWLAQCVVDV